MTGAPKYRKWIYPVFTILVAGYLCVATVLASRANGNRMMGNIVITVHDTADLKFVTPEGLARELGDLPERQGNQPLSNLNLDSLERALAALDNIEHITVSILNNDKLLIDAYPMRPVARIFPRKHRPDTDSYYINRAGKHMRADARYHLDVPVIVGDFNDATFPARALLPLIDYIRADSLWSAMVSMIEVSPDGDIFLIPAVRGHVINFGDTLDIEDKFFRLQSMYRKVMPAHGWEYYDTVSVKWNGQIVATRRDKSLPEPFEAEEEINAEDVDDATMMVGAGVSAGQAVSGAPINPDTQIPANKLRKANP